MTKEGFVLYSGEASTYHMWDFKTELKIQVTSTQNYPQLVSNLIESLRGVALDLAMDIGPKELAKGTSSTEKGGIDQLRDKIREHVFPVKKEEVKTLYREGNRSGNGVLQDNQEKP